MRLRAAKAPPVRVGDPLAVVPVRPDNVDLRRDSRDCIHLRLNVPVSRVKRWLGARLGLEFCRTVELDESGSLYYGLVDGCRSLRAIADALAPRAGLAPSDLERWVVAFTRTLMIRNLIALKVPPEAQLRSTP